MATKEGGSEAVEIYNYYIEIIYYIEILYIIQRFMVDRAIRQ